MTDTRSTYRGDGSDLEQIGTSPPTAKARLKRCAKCGQKKPLDAFNKSDTSHDGHQSYCKQCKSNMHKQRHKQNARARLRHHMATRIRSQLGDLAPENLTKDLDDYLGYRVAALVKALRADLKEREGKKLSVALEEGYHVDHIRPLSSFQVIRNGVVDWEEFRRCWAIDNLTAIPAHVNLAKGAKYDE